MCNSWECLSPDGFALNSKWNEAEKYICNPLSGEVPMECLSAKTLSGRSFRNLTNRITMSAPLIYPSNSRQFQARLPPNALQEDVEVHPVPIRGSNIYSFAFPLLFESLRSLIYVLEHGVVVNFVCLWTNCFTPFLQKRGMKA